MNQQTSITWSFALGIATLCAVGACVALEFVDAWLALYTMFAAAWILMILKVFHHVWKHGIPTDDDLPPGAW